jgi:hypothetical protein
MKNKNVFISHHHNDEEHIPKLKSLLEKNGFVLRNSSIDSSKPNNANNQDYVKTLLSEGIKWAGTTIVLIGPKTHQSEWVDWEIEKSYKEGNRVVGVYINGANDSDIPEEFLKHGDALVGWTGNRIIDAIEGRINNFENPDGSQTAVRWSQNREEC